MEGPFQIAEGVHIFKSSVGVGCGCGHLSFDGLRQRFVMNLDKTPTEEARLTSCVPGLSLPAAQLEAAEEVQYAKDVRAGLVHQFDIDTTTTAIQLADGTLCLHSPAPATPALVAAIRRLGAGVSSIIAPNLQHWLGCGDWAAEFPEATVFVSPPAAGEDLTAKLTSVGVDIARIVELDCSRGDGGSICGGALKYRLLEGAPLMLNEVAFLHVPSSTLILADTFYAGYAPASPPNVFTRLWFKMTRAHWSTTALPSYRTTRVVSGGDPELLIRCVKRLVADWAPTSLIGAHGPPVPVRVNPGEAFIAAWEDGLAPLLKQGLQGVATRTPTVQSLSSKVAAV